MSNRNAFNFLMTTNCLLARQLNPKILFHEIIFLQFSIFQPPIFFPNYRQQLSLAERSQKSSRSDFKIYPETIHRNRFFKLAGDRQGG